MNTFECWTELHDATLEALEMRWSSGDVILRIRTGDAMHPHRVVAASSVRRLTCSREMPWGFSLSINEVRGPKPIDDDVFLIEIEMQSGDIIRIEARGFSVGGDTL